MVFFAEARETSTRPSVDGVMHDWEDPVMRFIVSTSEREYGLIRHLHRTFAQ